MKEFNRKTKSNNQSNKLFSIFKIICRSLYKPALFLVSIQVVLISFLIYENRFRINSRINPRIVHFLDKEFTNLLGLSFDTFEINDYKDYFGDIFYSLISKNRIERIDLNLSFKDKQKLECMRLLLDNCTKDGWVRADLVNNNTTYKVKLKRKGDREIHRLKFKNMSFKADIRGEKRIFGMEEFSIQLPVIRNYTIEAVAADLLRSEDIASPRNFYVDLYINGEYVGLRHLEETISKELIESSQKRYGPVFTRPAYGEFGFVLNDEKVWQKDKSNIENQALALLEKSWGNPKLINKHFDLDKWAKYMSLLDLMMMIHGTVPKSVKYYLNPASGLIEPVFFDGHHGGWYQNYRISDALTKNNQKLSFPFCTLTCNQLDFYRMFFGNSFEVNLDFYQRYFSYLEMYSNDEYIQKNLTKTWKKYRKERGKIYRQFSKRDNISDLGLLPNVGNFQKIKNRFNKINKEINIAKSEIPKHKFSFDNNILELENNVSRYPQIYSLFCLDKELEKIVLVKNTKRIIDLNLKKNCNFDKLAFSLGNNGNKRYVSNMSWLDKDLEEEIKDSKNILKKTPNKDLVIRENKNFYKSIYWRNKNIFIKKGINICLGNGAIINVSESNLIFEGNSKEPVIIEACNKSSGSLLIENSRISFNNIILDGLNSPDLKLRKLYGGLNILNSEINGRNMNIKNSLSEDAVNFINSEIVIDKINFEKIKSDGLDSDFSNFEIDKITCNDIGNDCVDFSYSQGTINYLFARNVKDKGVSLGEASILNLGNMEIFDSEIGITAKDLSELSVTNFNFQNTVIPIASYIKKKELGRPIIKIKDIKQKMIDNEFISNDSEVFIDGVRIKGSKSSKDVSNKLYGNEFGVKTLR